ncbi:MAG: response regulator [Planctomycetia bacterium]|nr:response regulator [Planctomycetia bacterium]
MSTEEKRTRILIIDDDIEIGDSMKFALEATGFEVLIARNGSAGLALAEREHPDLIVLDMMMPKRSGFLVLETLRQHDRNPTRIIMVTANEGSRHRAYAEQLGVDEYLRKPFPMELLIATVQKVLAR